MSRDLDGDDPRLAALAYATVLGWRVVPIPRGSKHPSILDWVNAATTDVDTIKRWWDDDPTANVGIVCGPGSGVFVIDVDEHGAESGSDTLADLEATHGKLPTTPVALTGGGGAHYYFRHPPGVTIRNDAGMLLGPGIDIRAEGGQVVAPPSLHANGRHYTWDAASVPSGEDSVLFITASDEVPVADPPAWLLDLVTKAPPERERKAPEPKGEPRLPGERWAVETDWGDLLTLDGASFVGSRLDHRTGESYELWARPGIEGDHASASLGYGGSDVLKVFSTNWPGLSAGATYTKFGYYAATRHGGNFADARADLEAQGYEQKAIPLEDLIAKAEKEAADDEDDDPLPKLGIRPVSALFEGDVPEYDWLVPGLIERGDRVIITGDEGHGKSTLLRQMGIAASIGRNPFGTAPENVVHDPRRVLMVDCENSERQLRREFPKALGPIEDIAQVAMNFFVALRTAGLALDDEADREGDREWLARAIVALDPEMLLIGPLYKLLAGDPNSEPENRETAKFLDRLRRNARMALVIEAHAPHGQKRPYGWSGWKRWPEFGLHLSDDHQLIPFRGARDDSRVWPRALRRGDVGKREWLWVPETADVAPRDAAAEYEATTRMLIVRELKATGRRLTANDLSERLGRRKSGVLSALRHMEDLGGWVVRSELTKVSSNGRVRTYEAFQLDPEGHAFD